MNNSHTVVQGEYRVPENLAALRSRALIVGVVGILASFAVAFARPAEFLHGYLTAYMFWIGLTLGCLALLMLQYVTGGLWGLVGRRFLEAGSKGFVLMAILFLPIALGAHHLYEAWIGKDINRWLTLPGFYVRAVIYFVIWIGLAYLLGSWSRTYDEHPSPALSSRFQAISGPGLILYAFTITFAAVDWVMSIHPHWISTIYGLLYLAGQGLAGLAFLLIMLRITTSYEPYDTIIGKQQVHDIGKLMLAFTLLWAYFSYSQFLIIWSGNLPEEITWYLHRTKGVWGGVAVFIVLFHFFVPFAVMLSQDLKRNIRKLAWLAGFMLLMRIVDLFWYVAPSFTESRVQASAAFGWPALSALCSVVGIGGLWAFVFLLNLRKAPLLPAYEPQMELLLSQHHGH